MAKEINGIVKVIVPGVWSPYMFDRGVEVIYDAGPKEFIELFAGASFVVTNSFHGTAFSVNFNIPFYSTPRLGKRTNSRFKSLLSLLGIEDRIVYDGTEFEKLQKIKNVDFEKVNNELIKERNKSIDYLLTA